VGWECPRGIRTSAKGPRELSRGGTRRQEKVRPPYGMAERGAGVVARWSEVLTQDIATQSVSKGGVVVCRGP